MATLHIKPLTGNDANAGTSAGAAKQTWAGILAIAVANDTILMYPSEGDVSMTTSTSVTPLISVNCFVTIAPAEYSLYDQAYLSLSRTGSGSWSMQAFTTVFDKVGFKLNYGTLSSIVLSTSSSSLRRNTFYKTKWIITSSIQLSSFTVGANAGALELYDFDIDFSSITFSGTINFSGADTKLYSGRIGNLTSSIVSGATFSTSANNIAPRFVSWYGINRTGSLTNASYIFAANSQMVNCTIEASASNTNLSVFQLNAGSFVMAIVNNHVIRSGSNQFNVYGCSTAVTIDNLYHTMVGYNSYYDCNQFNSNVTWANKVLPDFPLANDGVITISPASADFMKPNNAAIIGTGFPVGLNIGARQDNSSISGETDPDKVLNTSLVISGNVVPVALTDVRQGVPAMLGTGSAYIPAAADVKLGVNVDATTGTLQSTDPGQSNVLSGITYYIESVLKTGTRTDANPANVLTGSGTYGAGGTSLTPSYTPDFPTAANTLTTDTTNGVPGTYTPVTAANVRAGTTFGNASTGLLDLPTVGNVLIGITYDNGTKTGTSNSTDPGVANVVSGITYYVNSVLRTGTRTSIYALLATSDVKIGVDRGDTQLGTYDGSERFTDIDLTQVVTGYTFRYNSLTDNRTGLRTSIYPVLPQSNVKFGIDRGDGQLGTDLGADFNSDPGVANVPSGIQYKYLSATNNRTGTNLSTNPGVGNVSVGVTYYVNSTMFTGTNTNIYPLLARTDVRVDVDRGDGQTGLLDLPLESQVLSGVLYDNNSKEGIIVLPVEADVKFGIIYGDGSMVGEYTSSADYPNEDKVLNGVIFDNGAKVGSLGRVPDEGTDVVASITEAARAYFQSVLGPDWGDMQYFKDPSRNGENSIDKSFGVRPAQAVNTKERAGKLYTTDQTFEIKLMRFFNNQDGSDLNERQTEQELIQMMEKIEDGIQMSNFGYHESVRIVRDIDRDSVEKVSAKALVCTLTVVVNYEF